MPQLTKKINQPIHLNVRRIFRESLLYIRGNFMFALCVFAVNMVYMLCFKAMEGGIANPFSILWLISYYIFWCFFYRYYYHLRPYFSGSAVLGSLTPSAKTLLMLFLVTLSITLLPMLPLFLGFNDVYLDIYENYLRAFDGMSSRSEEVASLWQIIVVYGVMSLLAPVLICRPYLAWISSIRGRKDSFRKVKERTKGNYWQFAIISALLLYPEALASYLDKVWGCHNWLEYSVSTCVFVYTNIVFARIYDAFYRHTL